MRTIRQYPLRYGRGYYRLVASEWPDGDRSWRVERYRADGYHVVPIHHIACGLAKLAADWLQTIEHAQ